MASNHLSNVLLDQVTLVAFNEWEMIERLPWLIWTRCTSSQDLSIWYVTMMNQWLNCFVTVSGFSNPLDEHNMCSEEDWQTKPYRVQRRWSHQSDSIIASVTYPYLCPRSHTRSFYLGPPIDALVDACFIYYHHLSHIVAHHEFPRFSRWPRHLYKYISSSKF